MNHNKIPELAEHIRAVLKVLEYDVSGVHFRDSPIRIAKTLLALTCGHLESEEDFLARMRVFDEPEIMGPVMVHRASFYSFCAHHGMMFSGTFALGYHPRVLEGTEGCRVLGLSKLIRIFRRGCKAFTTQERITKQATDWLAAITESQDVFCMVNATHSCMECRGVQSHGAYTFTSDIRGAFKNDPMMQVMAQSLVGR